MKKTNQLFATIVVLLLFCATTLQAQEKKEVKYITVTESHWDMDKEDFKMSEWKVAEKEYLEKVTMKNEYIMSASTYLHNLTPDNTEIVSSFSYASWEDIEKQAERSIELEKEAWPDEDERKAFLKNLNSYYSNEHSDEIYMPLSGVKFLAEKPTKDMVVYARKSHFAFPENGTMEEFQSLRLEGNKGITQKNDYIKGYSAYVHAWGADKTEYLEVYFLDSLSDLENMFDRDDELFTEAFPENDENKAKVKTWSSYFTGVHGDYVYTFIHDLAK
ncbi:hypothetical protein [Algibacter sp. L4_22]|uniref:hypothetical protein n=1 Tax=Algibacter sp. L4_22 TaxID=2942477 RepID=UPI00201B492F|nr:hypothetical protein [Algibacter sp. L4_22]MCL5126832.1 hypothetical protein [Algibacter sp. L4_22]